jgi:hypothetical protein
MHHRAALHLHETAHGCYRGGVPVFLSSTCADAASPLSDFILDRMPRS